jgi:hypothetical protein
MEAATLRKPNSTALMLPPTGGLFVGRVQVTTVPLLSEAKQLMVGFTPSAATIEHPMYCVESDALRAVPSIPFATRELVLIVTTLLLLSPA